MRYCLRLLCCVGIVFNGTLRCLCGALQVLRGGLQVLHLTLFGNRGCFCILRCIHQQQLRSALQILRGGFKCLACRLRILSRALLILSSALPRLGCALQILVGALNKLCLSLGIKRGTGQILGRALQILVRAQQRIACRTSRVIVSVTFCCGYNHAIGRAIIHRAWH